jgi:hypothetical protein
VRRSPIEVRVDRARYRSCLIYQAKLSSTSGRFPRRARPGPWESSNYKFYNSCDLFLIAHSMDRHRTKTARRRG